MENAIRRRFGLALRDRRKRLRLTQQGLGDRACRHRNYIGAVGPGEKNLSLSTMAKLATAVDGPLSMLMFEAECVNDARPRPGIKPTGRALLL